MIITSHKYVVQEVQQLSLEGEEISKETPKQQVEMSIEERKSILNNRFSEVGIARPNSKFPLARNKPPKQPLSVGDLLKRGSIITGGVTGASGILVAGDAVAGMSQQQIHQVLTGGSNLVQLTPSAADAVAPKIQAVTSNEIARFVFIGVVGGVLTLIVLKAINPRIQHRTGIGIAILVSAVLVTLLVALWANGVVSSKQPSTKPASEQSAQQ